jgi:hypothetical protein
MAYVNNPCTNNPSTADSWNAGREWALADAASGITQQYTAEAWERWARTKDWARYTQKDLDNSRRNFIHAYEQAMGRGGKRNPVPNGRSYVRRGVPPPRYWEPKPGDVVYIEGTKTRLGTPSRNDPDMFPLRPPVRGTTAMGAANLRQVAMIEPKENPNSGSDHPQAWDLAQYARHRYSRRAAHIKAVTDYLIKLRDQGNYNLKSATKAYYYVIEGAAKEYAKEYGSKLPPPAVKLEAARDLMSMVEGGR